MQDVSVVLSVVRCAARTPVAIAVQSAGISAICIACAIRATVDLVVGEETEGLACIERIALVFVQSIEGFAVRSSAQIPDLASAIFHQHAGHGVGQCRGIASAPGLR